MRQPGWANTRALVACLVLVIAAALAMPAVGQAAAEPHCPQILREADPDLCSQFEFERQRYDEFDKWHRYTVRPRPPGGTADAQPPELRATEIASLLRSAESIPSREFLELSFEDTIITGTLDLRNLSVQARLRFAHTVFFGSPTGTATPSNDYSLKLDKTVLHDQVVFDHVEFRNDVLIDQTAFQADLTFQAVTLGGALLIRDTEVKGSLRIVDDSNVQGQILLDNVSIANNLTIRNPNRLDRALEDRRLGEIAAQFGLADPTLFDEAAETAKLSDARAQLAARFEECPCTTISPSQPTICDARPLVPYCPTSYGENPVFLELTHVRVGRELEISGLGRDLPSGQNFQAPRNRLAKLSSLRGVSTPWLVLNNISVDDTARLINSNVDRLHLESSAINRLEISDNYFNWAVVVESEFGRASLQKNAYTEYLYLVGNSVSNNLRLVGSRRFKSRQSPTVKISSNQVLGSMYFSPDLDFSLTRLTGDLVDLSGNQVSGGLEIVVPVKVLPEKAHRGSVGRDDEVAKRWHGITDLSGSEIRGGLRLALAEWRGMYAHDLRFDPAVEEHLVSGRPGELKTFWRCGDQEPESRVHFILNATTVDSLDWRLPVVECFSWEGIGFDYAYWTGPVQTAEDQVDRMKLWLRQYCQVGEAGCQHRQPPDVLFRFSDYLSGLGQVNDSRAVLAEAKSASFPVSWSELDQPFSLLGNLIAQIIFFPTAFGTSPERAILIIVALVVLGGGWYWRMGRVLRTDWTRDRQAAPGASEPHARFEHPATALRSDDEDVQHKSLIPGFMQYDRDRRPQEFSIWRYSLDATLPIVDLHAYNHYYPKWTSARAVSWTQHILGWWVLTSALSSIAVF